jgi:chromosome segregation ATPase
MDDKEMIFRLTMRVQKLEHECANLQQDLDWKNRELQEANDRLAFLKDRNAILVKQLSDATHALDVVVRLP